jgi:hypothetical protein
MMLYPEALSQAYGERLQLRNVHTRVTLKARLLSTVEGTLDLISVTGTTNISTIC